ncbi:HTH_48 domain-containing protein [Trichonephila clavipes]|nr:HTH_48 domain-containing protein [Trichonephila clavipes]
MATSRLNGYLDATIIKQQYYIEVPRRFPERVGKKRPDLQNNNTWILHQHKGPVNIVMPVKQFLVDKHIAVLKHPPYSQDLTSYDFYLFLKGKNALMGKHFQSEGGLKVKTAHLLKMTPKESQHCFIR